MFFDGWGFIPSTNGEQRSSFFNVGMMFVTVVGLAVVAAPNLQMASGLIPMLPEGEGSLMYTLALAGGVGGTITLAAYGYWLPTSTAYSGPNTATW